MKNPEDHMRNLEARLAKLREKKRQLEDAIRLKTAKDSRKLAAAIGRYMLDHASDKNVRPLLSSIAPTLNPSLRAALTRVLGELTLG